MIKERTSSREMAGGHRPELYSRIADLTAICAQ
jgi:hypothetical protein